MLWLDLRHYCKVDGHQQRATKVVLDDDIVQMASTVVEAMLIFDKKMCHRFDCWLVALEAYIDCDDCMRAHNLVNHSMVLAICWELYNQNFCFNFREKKNYKKNKNLPNELGEPLFELDGLTQ
jgi:hypothetical protein